MTIQEKSQWQGKVKVGLGCYGMYIQVSEAGGVTKVAWEAEVMGMIKEKGTSQKADRKREAKEFDYKSTETSYISSYLHSVRYNT